MQEKEQFEGTNWGILGKKGKLGINEEQFGEKGGSRGVKRDMWWKKGIWGDKGDLGDKKGDLGEKKGESGGKWRIWH